MPKNNSIQRRIQKVEEYLNNLQFIADVPEKEFVDNPMRYGSAERFLQLAIEALIDIGNFIVAQNNWGKVESYRQIATVLQEKDVLTNQEAQLFASMIGLRNLLVHEYLTIDARKIYSIIKNDLGDLKSILFKLSTYV